MSDGIDERLSEVFQVVFELPADVDMAAMRQVTIRAWDSLGHVSLVTALESEFEIEISAVDSIEITSYEAARLLVAELVDEQAQ
jgi:acyl carrier protein